MYVNIFMYIFPKVMFPPSLSPSLRYISQVMLLFITIELKMTTEEDEIMAEIIRGGTQPRIEEYESHDTNQYLDFGPQGEPDEATQHESCEVYIINVFYPRYMESK